MRAIGLKLSTEGGLAYWSATPTVAGVAASRSDSRVLQRTLPWTDRSQPGPGTVPIQFIDEQHGKKVGHVLVNCWMNTCCLLGSFACVA